MGSLLGAKIKISEQKASWRNRRKKIDFKNFVTHSVLVWTITTLVVQGNRVHVHVQFGCICAFIETSNLMSVALNVFESCNFRSD